MNRHCASPLAALLLALPCAAPAGQHHEQPDPGLGGTQRFYQSSANEATAQRLAYGLVYYFKPTGRALLVVVPIDTAPDCDGTTLVLSTHRGARHEVSLSAYQNLACYGIVEAAWLVRSFSVRVPLKGRAPIDARFDTTSMDLDRIAWPGFGR